MVVLSTQFVIVDHILNKINVRQTQAKDKTQTRIRLKLVFTFLFINLEILFSETLHTAKNHISQL